MAPLANDSRRIAVALAGGGATGHNGEPWPCVTYGQERVKKAPNAPTATRSFSATTAARRGTGRLSRCLLTEWHIQRIGKISIAASRAQEMPFAVIDVPRQRIW